MSWWYGWPNAECQGVPVTRRVEEGQLKSVVNQITGYSVVMSFLRITARASPRKGYLSHVQL